MSLFTLSFLVLAVVAAVQSLPTGPPIVNDVCVGLVPASSAPHIRQIGHYGYRVITDLPLNATARMYRYTAGQQYSVNLTGNTFLGFIMQARDPGDAVIGTFQTAGANQQNLNCSQFNGIDAMATIAHVNGGRVELNSQAFSWTAPSNSDGYVVFRYTLVPRRVEYFGPLVSPPPPPQAPTRAVTDYPVTQRYPENCQPTVNCEIFVGAAVNAISYGYLDFYMEASSQSWVALGFSTTRSMFSADVAVCVYDSGMSSVVALDTYNAASARANIIDTEQNIMLFNSSRTSTTIQCTVSKRIMGANVPNQDLNLNAAFWMLYARGNTGSAAGINGHMSGVANRGISETMINPVTGVVIPNGATKVAAPGLLITLLAATLLLFMKM